MSLEFFAEEPAAGAPLESGLRVRCLPANAAAPPHRGPSALFVAHPGHELLVHGWLRTVRPWVFVLTDGSGRSGASRLDWTTDVLKSAKAKIGSVYGRGSDRQFYAWILAQRFDVFDALVEELADGLVRHGIRHLLSDAVEGYNCCHDLCRWLADAAARRATARTGLSIDRHDFLLTGWELSPADPSRPRLQLDLPAPALAEKLRVAAAYEPLRAEFQKALAAHGEHYFWSEELRPVPADGEPGLPADFVPFYERHGEALAAAGEYPAAIRYQSVMLPVFQHLQLPRESGIQSEAPSCDRCGS